MSMIKMGLLGSKLKTLELCKKDIQSVDKNFVVYVSNDKEKTQKKLYFDDKIAANCYNVLSNFDGNDKVTIYYKKGKIHVLDDDREGKGTTNMSYHSDKVSPTSFGWRLD